MIVNSGALRLLNAQLTYLAGLAWGLFVNNVPDAAANTFALYTEAAWAGYARVTVGPLGAPVLVSPRAQSQPTTQPGFTNTSGVNQSFYGWFLLDTADNTLIAAVNIGLTVLGTGLTFTVNQTFTDKNE